MNTQNNTLFSNFAPVTKEEWLEKVNIDLKGGNFDKQLVWRNLNDITLPPLYTPEDAITPLTNTGENAASFVNYRHINVSSASEASTQALKAIAEGITGLIFDVKAEVSVVQLLKDIDLNSISVSFQLEDGLLQFAANFFSYANNHLIAPENLKGFIDLNLITEYVTTGNLSQSKLDSLNHLVELSNAYPNYKTLSIAGTAFLDSGSNQVQEVAFTLNALVYLIESCLENEGNLEALFNNLHVQLGISSEYFVEIGKFRAFNSLLAAIAKTYGVTEYSHSLTAKTSVWSKSVTDPYTNLLRATTEAMSALLGNVDGVVIDPFDKEFKETSAFSNRIAGNISTILREESYFGKVANPVDGSYYIEDVSSKIADKALALFKEVETQGGFYEAFESEYIQQQIAEIRQRKLTLLSQRRLAMVGVNKYPNLMERIPSNILSEGSSQSSKLLTPRRATLEIEALRKTTEELVETTKKRPIVELSSFGNLTMRKARAAFSYDFLGVSGFEVWQEKSYTSAQEAAESSAASNSDVVVICSSDQDYETDALDFVRAFRAINKDKILLLAGNPVALIDSLKEAGLDNCIHIKSDVIQTISGIQHKLNGLVAH
ncbi:methylmalonyl-CoA mutase family protein [Mangrovimonas sp. DI 80]|uniref:methylmalonyl-CoA mutase family protein n=1 Tax=Mangrovimonas sp. DI 80 TaxID=1779330 RepID=UPI000F515D54|nr:methylmalonyl-CoA mutase family protein [Mangrovimonas sp. DI 80]